MRSGGDAAASAPPTTRPVLRSVWGRRAAAMASDSKYGRLVAWCLPLRRSFPVSVPVLDVVFRLSGSFLGGLANTDRMYRPVCSLSTQDYRSVQFLPHHWYFRTDVVLLTKISAWYSLGIPAGAPAESIVVLGGELIVASSRPLNGDLQYIYISCRPVRWSNHSGVSSCFFLDGAVFSRRPCTNSQTIWCCVCYQ